MNDLRKKLLSDGYCVVPAVLSAEMFTALTERFSDRQLAAISEENFGESGAFATLDYRDPLLVRLLTWQPALDILRQFGFASPKLHNFYVSTKPPQAEGLPWHSDLFYAYDEQLPAELFLIYYLQDTAPSNGCLRVVPGSHKWSHEQRHTQPDTAALRKDETDVPVRKGDLFVGDRRILHATHANTSAAWRTCLTIAYAPVFDQLTEPIQALIVQNRCLPPPGWWDGPAQDIGPALKQILPVYKGTARPVVPEA